MAYLLCVAARAQAIIIKYSAQLLIVAEFTLTNRCQHSTFTAEWDFWTHRCCHYTLALYFFLGGFFLPSCVQFSTGQPNSTSFLRYVLRVLSHIPNSNAALLPLHSLCCRASKTSCKIASCTASDFTCNTPLEVIQRIAHTQTQC